MHLEAHGLSSAKIMTLYNASLSGIMPAVTMDTISAGH